MIDSETTVQLRLPKSLKDAAMAKAKGRDKELSQVIRDYLRKYIKR